MDPKTKGIPLIVEGRQLYSTGPPKYEGNSRQTLDRLRLIYPKAQFTFEPYMACKTRGYPETGKVDWRKDIGWSIWFSPPGSLERSPRCSSKEP